MVKMLLQVQKVAKFFGNRCIFKNISFDIAENSLCLLMGANGAGKSTLLRIMAGLARPSAGQIHSHVDGNQVGYLGHSTFLYAGLTALENLRFWGGIYNINTDEQKLLPILQRVDLAPFAHEKAGVFSRGMAQRLNLARVLLLEPRLWLLDEPCTGLDVASASLLRNEVSKARDNGAGIVWISHDLTADAPLADRLIQLEKGRVAYDGPPLQAVNACQAEGTC